MSPQEEKKNCPFPVMPTANRFKLSPISCFFESSTYSGSGGATPSALQASSSSTSLLSLPSFCMAVKYGPCLLTLKKGSWLLKPIAWGNFSAFPTWSTKPTTGCRARSIFLWVHKKLLWQLSTDKNVQGSGTSHTATASPKPPFKAPWRMDNNVVSRGTAGWTTSKRGHSCICQNHWQGPLAEKAEKRSLLNCPSCPTLTQSVKGLNWTESWLLDQSVSLLHWLVVVPGWWLTVGSGWWLTVVPGWWLTVVPSWWLTCSRLMIDLFQVAQLYNHPRRVRTAKCKASKNIQGNVSCTVFHFSLLSYVCICLLSFFHTTAPLPNTPPPHGKVRRIGAHWNHCVHLSVFLFVHPFFSKQYFLNCFTILQTNFV